jgi:hypothetical protein
MRLRHVRRDAGIAGGSVDLVNAGIALQRPDQRVLAAPGPDDQNLHGRRA